MTRPLSANAALPARILDGWCQLHRNTLVVAVMILLSSILVFVWQALVPETRSNKILSFLINRYLLWRYPIKTRDQSTDLPTCPYEFPNGQGNTAKFFEGESGSRIWEARYGPMYRIWAGFTAEIVLTRSEQVQAVFKDSNMHIKGQNMDSGWLNGELLGQCLGLLNQDDWTRVRKVFGDPFHHNKSASYVPMIQRRVERHFDLLQKARLGRSQLLIRPSEDLKLLPFWILCDIFYGDLSDAMESLLLEIVPLREALWKDVMRGGISRFSLSRFLRTSTNNTLKIFKTKWAAFNDKAYQRAKSIDITLPIVSLYEAVEDGQLTRTELLQTLDEALFANLDVTIGNFSWNPVFLAGHPAIQQELRNEIKKARNEEAIYSWEKYCTSNSNLLSACILEAARLKPMAPFSIAQATPTDRVIGDFVVPAGTNFVVDSQALNILDPFWGENNTLYRPKRFLEARNMTEMRYRFWRYGFGPRQCLGKNIADVILKGILAHMVEHYRMSLSSGVSTDSGDWERKPDSWISLAIQDIICENV